MTTDTQLEQGEGVCVMGTKRSIPTLVDLVNLEEGAIREAESAIRRSKLEIFDLLNELKTRVISGESSDNRLVDLVIRVGCGCDSKTIEHFRQIESRLAGNTGKLVLLKYTAREIEDGWRTDRERVYREIPAARITLLEGEFLKTDIRDRPLFPTQQGFSVYSLESSAPTLDQIYRRGGDLFTHCVFGKYALPRNTDRLDYIIPPSDLAYQEPFNDLCIGDREVRAFLQRRYRNSTTLDEKEIDDKFLVRENFFLDHVISTLYQQVR